VGPFVRPLSADSEVAMDIPETVRKLTVMDVDWV
jgi:hypothetical protein